MARPASIRRFDARDNEDEIHVAGHAEETAQKRSRGGKVERRVAIACTACRKQHLRCDAATPACSRCTSLGKRCVYTDIRRPRRSSRKTSGRGLAQTSHGPELADVCLRPRRQRISPTGGSQERPQETEAGLFPASDDDYPYGISVDRPEINRFPSPVVQPSGSLQELGIFTGRTDDFHFSIPLATDDPLSSIPLDGFYTYFFPAHPFVLPRAQLALQCDTDSDSVSRLTPIMALIGALYTHDNKQSHSRRQDAERILEETLPSTGFTVQTFMLLALCLEWSGEGQRADDTLQRAKDVALEIGMDRKSFAVDFGGGNTVLEESWRRTWWELYVVDAFLAAIRHWPTFSLWKLGADVYLPADEERYISGVQNQILGPFKCRGRSC